MFNNTFLKSLGALSLFESVSLSENHISRYVRDGYRPIQNPIQNPVPVPVLTLDLEHWNLAGFQTASIKSAWQLFVESEIEKYVK